MYCHTLSALNYNINHTALSVIPNYQFLIFARVTGLIAAHIKKARIQNSINNFYNYKTLHSNINILYNQV